MKSMVTWLCKIKWAAGLVYNLIWEVAAALLTDWWLGFKVERILLKSHFQPYLKTHTLLMSVPAVRSRTSSVTSRFGGISECCRGTFEAVWVPTPIMHLANITSGRRYDRGCSYLGVKLHFCAEQLAIQSHQLSVSVMEVALEVTGADKESNWVQTVED